MRVSPKAYLGYCLCALIVGCGGGGSTVTTQSIAAAPAPAVPAVSQPGSSTAVRQRVLTYQEQLGSTQTTPFGTNYAGIAPYIDYALTDAVAAPQMHAAGVKVGFYSTFHTVCVPQATGECTPAVSDSPAAVFATTCNGDEVAYSAPNAGLVQLQTDPTSAALSTLFNSVIATSQKHNGGTVPWDFIFDDNAALPGEMLSYHTWYDANTGAPTSPSPYCNYTNASYVKGMQTLYTNATLPVIANAFSIPDAAPAASGGVQYLSAPKLQGGMLEYIYGSTVNGSARLKESGTYWQSEENTQLAVSNAHRLFVAYEHVGGTNAAGINERLYVYASLMLSFDQASLVLAQDGTTVPSQVGVNPEAQLVPSQPLVAQPTSILSLQSSGGAFVREFAACYYKGTAIGPCASIVNSSATATVAMPSLSRSYLHTAVISGAGIVPNVDNGKVAFSGAAAPAKIAPQTAFIVVQ